MIVLVLEKVSASVRGDLSRWLLEPKTGVFVGNVSAAVRDRLWERAREGLGEGAAVLIWSSDNEQGYRIEMVGERRRQVRDFEGLKLITLVE